MAEIEHREVLDLHSSGREVLRGFPGLGQYRVAEAWTNPIERPWVIGTDVPGIK